MSRHTKLAGGLACRKGEASPLAEPRVRRTSKEGRRVGATLPIETYVAFKAYVARAGLTGEQAIVAPIQRLLAGS